MQMPLQTDRLAAFVAVVRQNGFSRAARALGKTQSAVSQAVLHLEAELGQPLLLRGGRAPRLTEAGTVLLEHAERVLDDLASARERLAALGDVRAGHLTIGATDTLACHVLPPVLSAFRARFPGVELRLDNRPSPATAVRVAERQLDLGIGALPLPRGLVARGRPIEERLRIEPLVDHEDVVICPPHHPLAARRTVRLERLAASPLLLLDRSTGTRAWLDAAFELARARPTVHMEMSSVEVLKRLVELGFGVSVVPRLAVAREVRERSLVALRLVGARGVRRVGLVTPAASSRAAQSFAAVTRAVLSPDRRRAGVSS
jgi:DNA-binding transcriptional LysR family regulator